MAPKTRFVTLLNNANANQRQNDTADLNFFAKRCVTDIQAIANILGPKFCGVTMAEPKTKIFGTMEPPPPPMQLRVKKLKSEIDTALRYLKTCGDF